MIKLREYLEDRLALLLLFGSVEFLVYLFFKLYRMPDETFAYFSFLYGLLLLIFMLLDAHAYFALQKKLSDASGKIYQPNSHLEEGLYARIEKENQKNSDLQEKSCMEKEQLADAFALWVHQAKIPLSSLKLMVQEENPDPMQMKSQIMRMEQEMSKVMALVRMECENSDYHFEWIDLDALVREKIRTFRLPFILQKIHLDYEVQSRPILSDRKWLSFALEQILSNACKYTQDSIRIYTRVNPYTLIIEDNGPGVESADLMRLGQRGFTGRNGHAQAESSGLGLYLFVQTMRKLNHPYRFYRCKEGGFGVEIILEQRL